MFSILLIPNRVMCCYLKCSFVSIDYFLRKTVLRLWKRSIPLGHLFESRLTFSAIIYMFSKWFSIHGRHQGFLFWGEDLGIISSSMTPSKNFLCDGSTLLSVAVLVALLAFQPLFQVNSLPWNKPLLLAQSSQLAQTCELAQFKWVGTEDFSRCAAVTYT